MDIVAVDKLGRILLPKALRDELGLASGARLLAAVLDGQLVLRALDTERLLQQIRDDLQGIDIERISEDVRAEVEREAHTHIEHLLAGHQRPRGSDQEPAPPDHKPRARRRPGQ